MLIVSLDTSSQVSSVAVLSEERVAAEVSMQGALTHSETLMPHIELALQMARAKKTELDGIVVSIGPGSFTGLRIGLAAAKMMAYALNIPMICVPTLEALACHYAGSVWMRRKATSTCRNSGGVPRGRTCAFLRSIHSPSCR